VSDPGQEAGGLHIAPESIEALASRLAELLGRSTPEPERPAETKKKMLSPAEVSELWGVSRVWVYRHADALGVRRLGSGTRPRLRFDPEEIEERLGAPRRRGVAGDMPRLTAIAEIPHSDSLYRRGRATVGESKTDAAGGRANAPGPAPKEMLRRDSQPRPAGFAPPPLSRRNARR
jgi:predicted DNA-binding transcriptional regulator AlpA